MVKDKVESFMWRNHVSCRIIELINYKTVIIQSAIVVAICDVFGVIGQVRGRANTQRFLMNCISQ